MIWKRLLRIRRIPRTGWHPTSSKENSPVLDISRITFENALCLYHNDADGQCSAAIVRRALGRQVELMALEIGDPLPWDAIDRADLVAVVDFSFPRQAMLRIQRHSTLIWVDHHITALESLGQDMEGVPGRRSVDEAACVLTWQTFFPGQSVPRAVVYIGDRDIWRHAHPETRPFGDGLYQEECDPANDLLWVPLLEDDPRLLGRLIEDGEKLYAAHLRETRRSIEGYGFEVMFEGHRTLAINGAGTGDMGEMIRQAGYDLAYCYIEAIRNDRRRTFVTLYSGSVDVSAIARKYGGGGHRGAAGFAIERSGSPFPAGSTDIADGEAA
jgi:oligoribonuclease NrnB/cAMP/cGMP phosphodiesterase (DHH superfamily)